MTTLNLSDYCIFIGDHQAELANIISAGNYSQVVVLVDENTRQHCLPLLLDQSNTTFSTIEIHSGEQHKNLDTCQLIWQKMMALGLDRHSLLINLGGGVIGDMGGFCAATYLRGIDFVQIPTTLLSQVDASIGGKLGVDFQQVKNSIGLFSNPKAVFVNPQFLKTLPDDELRSGFAEVFKHALIADQKLWADLREVQNIADVRWPELLERSLRIKQHVVEQDPFERGLRKALNFGHTIGHAVESFSFSTKTPLLHGDAVAIGIICESWLSHKYGPLPENEFLEIAEFVQRLYPPFSFQENDFPVMLDFMKKDKKNRNSQINFTAIPSIGHVEWDRNFEENQIKESLLFYLSLHFS